MTAAYDAVQAACTEMGIAPGAPLSATHSAEFRERYEAALARVEAENWTEERVSGFLKVAGDWAPAPEPAPEPALFPRRPQEWDGRITITWPAPADGVLNGWQVSVADADTGTSFLTVIKGTVLIRATAGDVVWAQMEMFADPDGRMVTVRETPLVLHADPARPGCLLTGIFSFLVTEMRVRAEPRRWQYPAGGVAGDQS